MNSPIATSQSNGFREVSREAEGVVGMGRGQNRQMCDAAVIVACLA
ncbi:MULTISPECIES: hypothetical protein [Ralstonia]|jgi:hypothetical protein|nr:MULTISPECIES: hypothetical protein [Ralstonia]MCM3580459.1 hypothetical protein [Ralstonia pickettii]MEA3271106.1 hypothetical protein [Pseudomonadota bacterium]